MILSSLPSKALLPRRRRYSRSPTADRRDSESPGIAFEREAIWDGQTDKRSQATDRTMSTDGLATMPSSRWHMRQSEHDRVRAQQGLLCGSPDVLMGVGAAT